MVTSKLTALTKRVDFLQPTVADLESRVQDLEKHGDKSSIEKLKKSMDNRVRTLTKRLQGIGDFEVEPKNLKRPKQSSPPPSAQDGAAQAADASDTTTGALKLILQQSSTIQGLTHPHSPSAPVIVLPPRQQAPATTFSSSLILSSRRLSWCSKCNHHKCHPQQL